MSKQEYTNMLQIIKNINRRVKLHERLIAAEVQKRVYGRAALGVVVKNGMPTDLKVFASKNLGQVFVNPDWTFKSVVYFDNLIEKQEFAAQDLLYFTHHDFNITPDTFFYGTSEIEGIAHDSETNRIISEEDLKECAKGQWAGIGIIKAPGITTQDGANSLLNQFDPGKYNFVNQDVQVDVHNLDPKMDQLVKAREANDMRIGRSSGVPLPLLGYENITNRATMDSIMAVNKATMVEIERSLLQSQLEPQWYDTLCMKILSMDAEHFEAAQVRVVMEFAELIFDALGERAFTLFGLFDRECLTKADLLRELKLEQYIPALDSAEIKQRQALQDSIQGQKIARIANQSNETFSTQESKTNTPRQGAPGTTLMGTMAMASAAEDEKSQIRRNIIEYTKRKK